MDGGSTDGVHKINISREILESCHAMYQYTTRYKREFYRTKQRSLYTGYQQAAVTTKEKSE